MCNCISYNQPSKCPSDGRPEVVLPCPPHLMPVVSQHKQENGIAVDACIADVIRMLWEHKVETLGCCCGHGTGPASVVIAEQENAQRVKALLANEGRDWDVFQWRLVRT